VEWFKFHKENVIAIGIGAALIAIGLALFYHAGGIIVLGIVPFPILGGLMILFALVRIVRGRKGD
jgi:hypothetical protein